MSLHLTNTYRIIFFLPISLIPEKKSVLLLTIIQLSSSLVTGQAVWLDSNHRSATWLWAGLLGQGGGGKAGFISWGIEQAVALVVSFRYCQRSLLSNAHWTNQRSGGLTAVFSSGYGHCTWDTTYFSASRWIQTCTRSISAWERLLKASSLIMECWTYLLDIKQFGNTGHYQFYQMLTLRKHGEG